MCVYCLRYFKKHKQKNSQKKNTHTRQIESMGNEFNPNLHEAMFSGPSDDMPNNHIMQVISEGFQIKTQILRPAKVGVVATQEMTATDNTHSN